MVVVIIFLVVVVCVDMIPTLLIKHITTHACLVLTHKLLRLGPTYSQGYNNDRNYIDTAPLRCRFTPRYSSARTQHHYVPVFLSTVQTLWRFYLQVRYYAMMYCHRASVR